MKTLEELRGRAAALALELDELSKIEERTDEQEARFAEAMDEVTPLAEEIRAAEVAEEERVAREAKLDEIRTFAAKPGHVASGDGARVTPVPGASTRNIWDVNEARMATTSPQGLAAELRSRAATAIEQSDARDDDWREQATKLLERGLGPANDDPTGDIVARHWLTFGNPEYRKNWEQALRGDVVAMSHCQQETMRAAWAEGGTTTGGFAVVPDYDLTLLLVNAGSVNPFRQISRVVQTAGKEWKGLTTAGVTAGWNTESTEATDRTPTVAQPTITVHKADAYLQASFEVIADSNLGAEVSRLIQDAKDTLEADAFAIGTGGGQPYGVVTRCQGLNAYVFGDSGSSVEKEIVTTDIYALDNALNPRWRQNASFVGNKAIFNMIRQLGTANAYHAFWTDFGGGVPSKLIGYPVYESSAMDSTIVSGSQDDVLVLGDFRNGYIIADRIGMTMAFNPLVVGSNRRPTGEVGWYAYWRTGADVVDQTAAQHFKLLHK